MEYFFIGFIAFLAFLSWVFLNNKKKKKLADNLPPGSTGIPVFGCILKLFPRRYVTLTELSRTHGDVMMLPLFTTQVLVLSSYDALQEAFVNQADAFSGRPQFRFLNKLINKSGIVLTDGDTWLQHRRFALRTLRNFGFGKTLSLTAVHQEARSMLAQIDQEGQQGMDTLSLFSRMTANVICSLMFGDRVASEDEEFPEAKQALDDLVACDSRVAENIPLYFPWVMDIPFFMTIYNKFTLRKRMVEKLISYIEKKVLDRTATINSVTEPRDFTDAILLHKLSLEEQGDTPHTFDIRSIAGDVFDLFAAGTDTTAVTLSWACLLLASHPVVQQRAREEVLEVLGDERLPTTQDRPRLNYTLAVLDEVSRFASIVPNSVTHRTEKATTLKGYFIPADTLVIPNIYGVHMDPSVWDNPSQFEPRHFLDENDVYKPSAHLIPFSLGKRACLGESLARMELFVFFVSVLQRYEVALEESSCADLEELLRGTNGLIRHLEHHRIVFKRLD